MKYYYRQCKLEHREVTQHTGELRVTHTTTWIPEQFAKLNNKVDLWAEENKVWTRGWRVTEVGARKDAEYVLEHERNYTKQREASDI